jgi:hypothetical protein
MLAEHAGWADGHGSLRTSGEVAARSTWHHCPADRHHRHQHRVPDIEQRVVQDG